MMSSNSSLWDVICNTLTSGNLANVCESRPALECGYSSNVRVLSYVLIRDMTVLGLSPGLMALV